MRTLILLLSLLYVGATQVHAAPPPVEAYAQIPALRDGAISPDGSHIAVIGERDGNWIVRIIDVTNLSDPVVKSAALPKTSMPKWVKWANNNRVLVSVKHSQTDGSGTVLDFTNIITINAKTLKGDILIKQKRQRGVGSKIGSDAGGRQFNDVIIDWLSDDPDHILMAFSDEDRYAADVQKVNVETGRYQTQNRGGLNTQYWYTDLDGNVRIGQGRRDLNGKWQLMVRRVGEEFFDRPKDYPGLKASSNIVGFTENPDELIIARRNGKNTLGLSIYNLAEKRFTRELFSHPKYDVQDVLYSNDGKKLIGAKFTSTHSEVEFFDADEKALISEISAKAEGYNIRFLDQTSDKSKTLVWATSSDEPSLLLLYNDTTKALDFLGSAYPGLKDVNPAYVQAVKYTARDGQKIPAFVTLPAKAVDAGQIKNLPFIVMPHGGPHSRDSLSFDYMAQMMASRGYGVLQMNFRGSTGYGLDFLQAGRDSWSLMHDDVEDGTKWLAEKGYADADRICIMGWSFGGYAALMAAADTGELYQCSASIAGVSGLNNLALDVQKYRFGKQVARSLGAGFEDRADVVANSPIRHVDKIKIPVFLAHGTEDGIVEYDHSDRMAKALKRAGTAVTYIEIDDGDHSLLTVGNERVAMMKKLVGFIEDNLGKSEWAN